MVTVSLLSGQVAGEVMADALIGYRNPAQYAVSVFKAVNQMAKLGVQIPAGDARHDVVSHGIPLVLQKTLNDRDLRFVGGTQGTVHRQLAARFLLGAQTPERIRVDALAATSRGAVKESHVFRFPRQEDGSRVIEVSDGNVDLTKAKADIDDPIKTVAFDRGVSEIEIPRSSFSETLLRSIFPDFSAHDQTEPMLILGLAVYAAQSFHSEGNTESLSLSLTVGSENLFSTNDLSSFLEVVQNPDEGSRFDAEALKSIGELLRFFQELTLRNLETLRQGVAVLGTSAIGEDATQILNASERLVQGNAALELRRKIDHELAKIDIREFIDTISELIEGGDSFTVSVGLPSDESRLNVRVTHNAVSIKVRMPKIQTTRIDLSRYHQRFLSPMVQHILGSEPGPIELIRILTGRNRRRKNGKPSLTLIPGGRKEGEE